jgi:ribulose-bisphosphate carboxylase small chain
MTRRLETFSYLELAPDELAAQLRHIVERRLVVAIEYSERPDPYDHYWRLWKLPLFGVTDTGAVERQLAECREANPDVYVKVNGYDPRRQGQVVSFVAYRPGVPRAA